ncbi:WW domain-containing oxidoreductase [Termitomyces sp. J132]|nr:hypothetical protein H2248_000201 [Termitomyces sp. 'cryptogamus']KNZ75733.1 WW domain-containing oxidoreductase [Termitomyces sp. J132]
MSEGTIVLTGANGTLGLAYVAETLKYYPNYHLVLTVRNDKKTDINTSKLYTILSRFPVAKYSIHTLDLASLDSVSSFASHLTLQVSSGALRPITVIICNAFAWSLISGIKLTSDGYELSFQVNYLAHFVLVLQLLKSMDKMRGRVVGLSSDSHRPGGSHAEVFPPVLPNDFEALLKPPADEPGKEVGKGFQRYGVSKLCVIMFIYELNRRLQWDSTYEELRAIKALAVDPGTITDSRALVRDVPGTWSLGTKYVLNPLRPLLKYAMPELRSSSIAGKILVELSLKEAYGGKHMPSYYEGLMPTKSSRESYHQAKAAKLWDFSVALMHRVLLDE